MRGGRSTVVRQRAEFRIGARENTATESTVGLNQIVAAAVGDKTGVDRRCGVIRRRIQGARHDRITQEDDPGEISAVTHI
ncbi:hypothetical protein D3C83_129840 [compost metagenome]